MIADLIFSFFSPFHFFTLLHLHSALRVMDTNEHQGGLQFQESCSFGPFNSLHGVGFDPGYFLSWAVPIPSTSRAVVQTFERRFTLHLYLHTFTFGTLYSQTPACFPLFFPSFSFFFPAHTAPPSIHLSSESCFPLSLLCAGVEKICFYIIDW